MAPEIGVVNLKLYLDTGFVQSIYSGTSNSSGSYYWKLPAGLVSSSKYRIQIQNYSNSKIFGSSAPFSISGITPDTYEPDIYRGAAKAIAIDSVVQPHNLTLDDTDYVSFDALPGQILFINLSSVYSQIPTVTDSVGKVVTSQTGTNYARVLPYLNPAGLGGWVKVHLYKAGLFIQTINSSVYNSGSLSFRVSTNLSTDTDYSIKIIREDYPFGDLSVKAHFSTISFSLSGL